MESIFFHKTFFQPSIKANEEERIFSKRYFFLGQNLCSGSVSHVTWFDHLQWLQFIGEYFLDFPNEPRKKNGSRYYLDDGVVLLLQPLPGDPPRQVPEPDQVEGEVSSDKWYSYLWLEVEFEFPEERFYKCIPPLDWNTLKTFYLSPGEFRKLNFE